MNTLGKHVILELSGCRREALNDYQLIKDAMLEAARIAKATVLRSDFHRFSPEGISGTVIVSESHLAIHTWPEYGYAALDIYTCGETDPLLAAKHIVEKLGAKKVKISAIKRGIPTDQNHTFHEHKILAFEGNTSLLNHLSSWSQLEEMMEEAVGVH